jgi:hypothetical protein
MKHGSQHMKTVRRVMQLTRRDVEAALRRLMKQRREVLKLRRLARRPEDIEALNRIMEAIQLCEKERLLILARCSR